MTVSTEDSTVGSLQVGRAEYPRLALLKNATRRVLLEHRLLLYFIAVYLAGGVLIVSQSRDHALATLIATYPSVMMGTFTIVASVAAMFTVGYLYRTRPDHPFGAVANAFAQPNIWPEVIARTLILVVGAALATGMFSAIKAEIPFVVPFTFDETFVRIDAFLHGGIQPWVLLHPVLGHPSVTDLLDRVYYLWFPVIFHTFYWQIYTRKLPVLRLQFLTAYLLSWMLIGSLAALGLSSAGPVFLAGLGLDGSPYADLLNYLHEAGQSHEIFALTVQDRLWQAYAYGIHMPFEGITAMPSMHVAIAVLLALFGWRRHWALGVAYTLFAILIFLGSIHLAFHYAFDGYVAALMVIGIWVLSGRLARYSYREKDAVQAIEVNS